jgi:hypothetical protein
LGIFMPRTSLQSSFRSPAKLGDEIAVGVGVAAISDRRIEYAFDIREQGSDRLICEASYRVACVDARTFTSRTFPHEIMALLSAAVSPHAERRVGARRGTSGTEHPATAATRTSTHPARPSTRRPRR